MAAKSASSSIEKVISPSQLPVTSTITLPSASAASFTAVVLQPESNAPEQLPAASDTATPLIHVYKSSKTLKNRTCMTKKSLPQTPEKWAGVISNILKKATPRKRKAFSLLEPNISINETNDLAKAPKRMKYDDKEAEVAKEILQTLGNEKPG